MCSRDILKTLTFSIVTSPSLTNQPHGHQHRESIATRLSAQAYLRTNEQVARDGVRRDFPVLNERAPQVSAVIRHVFELY